MLITVNKSLDLPHYETIPGERHTVLTHMTFNKIILKIVANGPDFSDGIRRL